MDRDDVESARQRWLEASETASSLASQMHQPGSGYGDPQAMLQDQHRLDSARTDADRAFREYHDVDRRLIDRQMLELQRSQLRAAWGSLLVATVVGTATVVSIVIALTS